MSHRKITTRRLRNGIWYKLVGTNSSCPCHWCNKLLTFNEATTDHIIPRSRGGTNRPENVVISCVECNRKRDIEDKKLYKEHYEKLTNKPSRL